MPRRPSHPPVARINPATIREAFRRPAGSDAGYYILEKGRTLVCLRVRQASVKIGVRHHSRWYSVAEVHAEMSIEEVEGLRLAALQLARQLQDGAGRLPAISRGSSMSVATLHQEFLTDLRETKGEVLRESTLRTYKTVWERYLLPALGHLTLPQISVEVVRQLKRDIPSFAVAQRPECRGGGRLVANLALQQLSSALDFAVRMEWLSRNVASARLVPRYEKRRSEEFLDAAGYRLVGEVLRDFEERLVQGRPSPISLRALLALRVVIYTGVRHRSELLWTRFEWCRFDDPVPRIGIPRAKGDRGGKLGGRWIFLGPDAVRCLREIPRPAGSEHLTVPGKKPGEPYYRLNHAWSEVLRAAGLPEISVKALRHGFSTHSVGIIAPEHRAQLMGHRGRPMTDTVYLHQHGPDLAQAAARVEAHLRRLMGDLQASANEGTQG
jgi:integrase